MQTHVLSMIISLCIAHLRDPSISPNHHFLSVVCSFLLDVFIRISTDDDGLKTGMGQVRQGGRC